VVFVEIANEVGTEVLAKAIFDPAQIVVEMTARDGVQPGFETRG